MKPTQNADSNKADAKELEKQIRTQNVEYFKVYDEITENIAIQDQIDILTFNEQSVPTTNEQVSMHATLPNGH